MSDMPSPSAPQPAVSNPGEVRHTLTVEHVGVLLTQAGVPRSRRQIIRYCQTELLDAVKIPGPTGDQWYVAPASIPKAIGDLKQWDAQRERRAVTRLDVSNSVHPMSDRVAPKGGQNKDLDMASPSAPKLDTSDPEFDSVATSTEKDEARHGAPEPDMHRRNNSERFTASYVSQLEKRIEEKDDFIGLLKGQLTAKDEQIGELSTRYRETHTLLGAMQRMFAPLLGQADPYQSADQQVGPRVDNSPPPGN